MRIVTQDRKLKWNVTIMVILILLACSLFGILTIIFLNSLISYTDDSYGYYKSYYTAKAWLELALTEINNSSAGFSHKINTWDDININNFDCVWCHFQSEILWRSSFISDNFWLWWETCDDENALTILSWWSMVLPLFYDNSQDFSELISFSKCLSWNDCSNQLNQVDTLSLVFPNSFDYSQYTWNIWVVFLSWDDVSWDYLYMKWMKLNPNLLINYYGDFLGFYGSHIDGNLLPYIVLSNPTTNGVDLKFCIRSNDEKIPTTKYFISSVGEYMWKTVWLQAIYAQPVASFLVNPYLWL